MNAGDQLSSQLQLSNTISLPNVKESNGLLTFSRPEDGDDSSTTASSSDDEQGDDEEEEGAATGSLLRSALTGKATFRSSSPSGLSNRSNNFNSSVFEKGGSLFKTSKSVNSVPGSSGNVINTSALPNNTAVSGAKVSSDSKSSILPFSANSLLPLPQNKSSLNPSEKPSPQKVEEIILLAMQKTNETVGGGGGGLLTTVKPTNNVHLLGIKSPSTSLPSSILQQIKSPAMTIASSTGLTINTNSTNLVPPAALRTLIPVSASVCGINTSGSNITIGTGGDRNNNLKRPLVQQQTQQSSPPTANVISLVLDVNNGSNSGGSNGQRSTINFIEPSLPRPIGIES